MDPSYNQQPISSGTGDIVLPASNTSNNSKKIAIISIAALFIIAAVVLIVVLVSRPKTTPEEAVAALYDQISQIETGISVNDNQKSLEYLNNIKNSTNTLRQLLSSERLDEDNLANINSRLDDIIKESTLYTVTDRMVYSDDIYEYYMVNSELDGVFSGYGFPLTFENENSFLSDAQYAAQQYINIKKDIYDINLKNGCVQNQSIVSSCVDQLINSNEEYSTYYSASKKSESLLKTDQGIILEMLQNNIKQIKQSIEDM